MFGLKFNLKFVIEIAYKIAATQMPGLSILVPLPVVLKIIDTIQVGMDQPIVVDWKISNVSGLMEFMSELMQAAVFKTEKEQMEAIYAMLCYLTTLEEFIPTKEEFIERAGNTARLLPASEVFPDQEMKKACELSALPA